MKKACASFVRRIFSSQRGQVLVWVSLGMVAMLGMGGFTIDLGRFYVVRSQLQSATDAAGLAAAGSIFDTGSLSITGATNAALGIWAKDVPPGFPSATIVTTTPCLNLLESTGQTACANDSNGNASPITTANAIRISTQVSMPTTFMRLFGVTQLATAAKTTASLEGPANLWNIAIIVDTTGSMDHTDTSDSTCSNETKMQCALQAVQVMLASMQPCATGVSVANCTSTSSYANAHVALFSFPNMLTSALPNAISGCSGTATPIGAPNAANPTTTWYGPATLPIPGTAGSYVPLTYVQNGVAGKPTWSASYEVTYGAPGADANGFLSDYYDASNTTAGKLNPASSLIGAIGYTGTATKYGCLPVSPDGLNLNWSDDGDSPQWITPASVTFQSTTTVKVETTGTAGNLTFYAGAIYAAQQALLAEQQSMLTNFNKVTQNAIVLVGDGAQSSQWIFFPQGTMQQNISNTYYPPIAWPQALAAPTGPPSTQQIRLNALADYLPLNTATGALASTASSIAIGTNPLTSTAYPPGYDTLNTVPNYKSYIAQAYFSFPGYEYWDGGTTNRANTPKVGGVYITGLSSLSGYYPDFIDECQQSVIAGQYAANQGTKVFTVAYDSDNQGCNDYNSGKDIQHFNDVIQLPSTAFPRTLNDTTYSTLGNVNPCSTMENIASGLTNFYSDSGTGCTSPDHSTTDLKGILGAIGMTFTSPRLLPNNAT